MSLRGRLGLRPLFIKNKVSRVTARRLLRHAVFLLGLITSAVAQFRPPAQTPNPQLDPYFFPPSLTSNPHLTPNGLANVAVASANEERNSWGTQDDRPPYPKEWKPQNPTDNRRIQIWNAWYDLLRAERWATYYGQFLDMPELLPAKPFAPLMGTVAAGLTFISSYPRDRLPKEFGKLRDQVDALPDDQKGYEAMTAQELARVAKNVESDLRNTAKETDIERSFRLQRQQLTGDQRYEHDARRMLESVQGIRLVLLRAQFLRVLIGTNGIPEDPTLTTTVNLLDTFLKKVKYGLPTVAKPGQAVRLVFPHPFQQCDMPVGSDVFERTPDLKPTSAFVTANVIVDLSVAADGKSLNYYVSDIFNIAEKAYDPVLNVPIVTYPQVALQTKPQYFMNGSMTLDGPHIYVTSNGTFPASFNGYDLPPRLFWDPDKPANVLPEIRVAEKKVPAAQELAASPFDPNKGSEMTVSVEAKCDHGECLDLKKYGKSLKIDADAEVKNRQLLVRAFDEVAQEVVNVGVKMFDFDVFDGELTDDDPNPLRSQYAKAYYDGTSLPSADQLRQLWPHLRLGYHKRGPEDSFGDVDETSPDSPETATPVTTGLKNKAPYMKYESFLKVVEGNTRLGPAAVWATIALSVDKPSEKQSELRQSLEKSLPDYSRLDHLTPEAIQDELKKIGKPKDYSSAMTYLRLLMALAHQYGLGDTADRFLLQFPKRLKLHESATFVFYDAHSDSGKYFLGDHPTAIPISVAPANSKKKPNQISKENFKETNNRPDEYYAIFQVVRLTKMSPNTFDMRQWKILQRESFRESLAITSSLDPARYASRGVETISLIESLPGGALLVCELPGLRSRRTGLLPDAFTNKDPRHPNAWKEDFGPGFEAGPTESKGSGDTSSEIRGSTASLRSETTRTISIDFNDPALPHSGLAPEPADPNLVWVPAFTDLTR